MKVTETEIIFIKPQNGLIAFASVVLDDQLYLGGIAIHQKLGGGDYRLTYPTRKLGDNSTQIFHPIRKSLGADIEQAVFQKMKDVVIKQYVRHNSTNSKPDGI